MTQEEFKAWFDGFCEGVDKLPTEKQWERIKERVKEINGTQITRRVFIDYYDPYNQYRIAPSYPQWGFATTCGSSVDTNKSYSVTAGPSSDFSSTSAMYDLGSAESKEA